jgi:hypothetical protein
LGDSDDSESIPASYAVMFSSKRAAAGAGDDVEIENLFAECALELDIDEVKAEVEYMVGTGEAEFVEPES